jgi:Ca2+-binding RTX toxin-like protein
MAVTIVVAQLMPVTPEGTASSLKLATWLSGSSTEMTLLAGADEVRITGSGLTFDAGTGLLTGGTIQTVEARLGTGVGATLLYSMTGLNYAVAGLAPVTPLPIYGPDVAIDYSGKFVTATSGQLYFQGGSKNDTIEGSNSEPDGLTGLGGGDSISGLGESDTLDGGGGADTLRGGSGNDLLYGGAGKDSIDGGNGSDWYAADKAGFFNPAKSVDVDLTAGIAKGSFGTDTLTSIENARGLWGNDTLDGSSGKNRLRGEDGKDKINGRAGNDTIDGGQGADTITGGAGKDMFVFSTSAPTGPDRITDYSVADDTIIIDRVALKSLKPFTQLTDSMLALGKSAQDSDDFLIYDKSSGKLWYDPDGSGTEAKRHLATFDGKPNLKASEFKLYWATEFTTYWLLDL